MADDDKKPAGSGTALALVKAVAGLPGKLSASAVRRVHKACSTVIGVTMPDALAQAQSSKDERDARSLMMHALARAAADKAAQNPEMIDRMVNRLIQGEVRNQDNRERVFLQAADYLDQEPADVGPNDDDEISGDWLNVFGSFAEKASSNDVRDIWARVLAGEIRRPGSFSLATLSFVSIVDARLAALINKVLPWVVDGHWFPHNEKWHGIHLHDFITLEQIGFGSGATGGLSKVLKPQPHGNIVCRAGENGFILEADKYPLNIRAFTLTIPARELHPVVGGPAEASGIVNVFKGTKHIKRVWAGTAVDKEQGYSVQNAILVWDGDVSGEDTVTFSS
jgi:hypothetical protein